MQMLKSRLYEIELEKQRAERDKIESTKMKNEWDHRFAPTCWTTEG